MKSLMHIRDRRAIKLCFAALSMLVLYSCDQPLVVQCYHAVSPNFLVAFNSVDSIKVTVASPELIVVEHAAFGNGVVCGDKDGKYSNTEIAPYCAKYADDHYGREIAISSWCVSDEHVGYMEDPVRITVTSGSDFDTDHPAGTSLNDLISWSSMSIYPYIKRGYTDPFSFDSYSPENIREERLLNVCTLGYFDDVAPDIITKQLSNLSREDMKIMKSPSMVGFLDSYGCFGFTAKPEKIMLHGMRIEVELEDGRVLGTQFPVDFS